jgi:hypothetical protein
MSFLDPSFTRDPTREGGWLVHGPAVLIRRHAADGTPLEILRADGSLANVVLTAVRDETNSWASAEFTNHLVDQLPEGRL